MFIYIIGNEKHSYFKIGVSNNPLVRLSTIQTNCPFEVELITKFRFSDLETAYKIEKELHCKLNKYLLRGEWFKISLNEINDLSKYIINHCPVVEDSSKQNQTLTVEIRVDLISRELKRIELFETVSGPAFKAFMVIRKEMMRLLQNNVKGKVEILRENKLLIDPEFLFKQEVVIKENYKSLKDAKGKVRKITKELVKANVLYPLERKDEFLINPQYFYEGLKYGDCYKTWCLTTGEEYQLEHNASYHQTFDGRTWCEVSDKSKDHQELIQRKINTLVDKKHEI